MSILELNDVHAYYGKIHALKGISLKVEKGEIVWQGDSDALESDKQAQDAYLSV